MLRLKLRLRAARRAITVHGSRVFEEVAMLALVRVLLAPSLLALALAACAGAGSYFGTSSEPPPPAPAVAAPPPPNMNPGDLVGRWGLAAYHKEADRARTEVGARNACNNAYVIGRGPSGGVIMHLADTTQPLELRLKQGSDGRVYLGPEGPAPDSKDREVVTFDGRMLVLRYVDPDIATRYGTSIFVRCGAPGTVATKRKAG
jgi:hypothetical protein